MIAPPPPPAPTPTQTQTQAASVLPVAEPPATVDHPSAPRCSSVLVVTAVPPVPVDNGKRAVLSGLLQHLVERLGRDQVHYALVVAPGAPLPDLPCVVHRLDKPSVPEQLLQGTWQVLTHRSGTLQEALLSSRRLRAQIAQLVHELDCDLTVYDTVRMAQHRPASSSRSIVYLDDLFSVRYARMLDVQRARGSRFDPLGEFVAHVPPLLRALVRRPAVYAALLSFERHRTARREVEVARCFDDSLLVSAPEVELLRARSGSSAVHQMTPLLPERAPASRRPATPPEFLFLGRLNVPHNDDAICSFLRQAGERLWQLCPDAVVRVVGAAPSTALRALAAERPGSVVLDGFVPDLDEVFQRATAVLAPLRFGSGIKIKVLEALARGVPVVGTPTAFEGIPVRPDREDGCVVEDDLARWPEALVALTMPHAQTSASSAAAAFYAATYSRAGIERQYDALFGLGVRTGVPHGELAAGRQA